MSDPFWNLTQRSLCPCGFTLVANTAHDIDMHPVMAVAHYNIAKWIADPPSGGCKTAFDAYKMCVGTECAARAEDAVKDLPEMPTCGDLSGGDFCEKMGVCITGACASWDCQESMTGMVEACEAEMDNTERMDCPGLCGWSPASYLRQG